MVTGISCGGAVPSAENAGVPAPARAQGAERSGGGAAGNGPGDTGATAEVVTIFCHLL